MGFLMDGLDAQLFLRRLRNRLAREQTCDVT